MKQHGGGIVPDGVLETRLLTSRTNQTRRFPALVPVMFQKIKGSFPFNILLLFSLGGPERFLRGPEGFKTPTN